jgi:hypothetical protein
MNGFVDTIHHHDPDQVTFAESDPFRKTALSVAARTAGYGADQEEGAAGIFRQSVRQTLGPRSATSRLNYHRTSNPPVISLQPAGADNPVRFECGMETTHKSQIDLPKPRDHRAPRRPSKRAVSASPTLHCVCEGPHAECALIARDAFGTIALGRTRGPSSHTPRTSSDRTRAARLPHRRERVRA